MDEVDHAEPVDGEHHDEDDHRIGQHVRFGF